jgi:hypothetical protein
MIVRGPSWGDQRPFPVGLVSKRYALVQHADVLGAVASALCKADIALDGLSTRLTLTELGTRMAARIELPERFAFTPPDGNPMALTFECFNSVDRSVALFAVLGWFRFVCANGLVVGVAQAHLRQQHRLPLRIDDLEPLLAEGVANAQLDRMMLAGLMQRRVTRAALEAWVDGPVAHAWGPVAAARVNAICTGGVDGEPSRTPRAAPPHGREIVRPRKVPGALVPCDNAYGLTQALAWIAARRRNVDEQLAWRSEIAGLVAQAQ